MGSATPSLRELFERAVPLSPEARREFLSANCPDLALRERLERMLVADAARSDPLPLTPAERLAHAIGDMDETPALPPGSRIGPFELVEILGEGGFSTVFRAARVSEGVRQEVALKVLRRSLFSPDAQRQFRRERVALTQLRHPGIARLIEGGVTDNGLAYIALELVDGRPITEYVRVGHLDLRRRLLLFIQICRAVEAAHRALIVHRDLKPSNVLVTSDEQVKLLDFGIAKLLAGDGDGEAKTQFHAFTPAYAAPEQFADGAVTTATDVYSLGVLLGEIVTGQRLSGGRGGTPSSQISRQNEPGVLPLPAAALRRQVRGDLDNILLKAMAVEPERRYAFAGALADDIERFLQGRPVAAHPPTRWYRAEKFVLRHRGAVAISAALMLAIVASLGIALWQANLARHEAQRANSVRDFVIGLFDAARARLPRDQRPTPDVLVAQAVRRVESDNELDQAARAEVLQTLGEVSLSAANFAQAERLFSQALALHPGTGGEDRRARVELRVLHAETLQRTGRNGDAAAEINAALPDLRGDRSATLIRALMVLAAAEMGSGETDAAIAHSRELANIAAEIFPRDHKDELAAALAPGNALSDAQRYPESITALEPVLKRWRESGVPQDNDYVVGLTNLANAEDGVGNLPATEARYRELLTLKRQIYDAPHDEIARSLRSLGLVVGRAGKYPEAETLEQEALAMDRQLFGNDHEEVVADIGALATLMGDQRHFEDADNRYLEAIAICERAQISSEVCPRQHNNLGQSYYRQGRLDEARREMELALAGRRKLFGDEHPTIAYSLSTLANISWAQKDQAESLRLSSEAVAMLDRLGRAGSREGALVRSTYAQALWLAERNEDALKEIDRCLADWQHVAPEGRARRVVMLVLKAQILRDSKRGDDARKIADEAIAVGAPASELSPKTKQLLRDLSGRSGLYPESAPGTH